MVLNTLCNSVKRKSHRGSQSITTDQVTTDIIACANEALRDVYKLIPKRYLFDQGTIAVTAGSTGTASVWSLDSTCQEPIIFWYVWTAGSNLFKLEKVYSDQEWFSKIWNNVTPPNQPLWFREVGSDASGYKQIEIFPPSSASLTLNYEFYLKKPTDLTTADLTTEIPVIPDLFHDVIEKGALYYFLKGFDDQSQVVAKADYEQAKEAMNQADEQDQDGLLSLRWEKVQTMMPGFRLS